MCYMSGIKSPSLLNVRLIKQSMKTFYIIEENKLNNLKLKKKIYSKSRLQKTRGLKVRRITLTILWKRKENANPQLILATLNIESQTRSKKTNIYPRCFPIKIIFKKGLANMFDSSFEEAMCLFFNWISWTRRDAN